MQMMMFLKKEILHHFGHLILSFGTFGSFRMKNQTNPLLLMIWSQKVKNHYSLFTVHWLPFIDYHSLITVQFLLFIGTIHYAFYAYLRGDVPYIKQNSLEPELSLGLLLSFRIPL